MDEIHRCRRLIMIGAGTSFHIALAVSIFKLSIEISKDFGKLQDR